MVANRELAHMKMVPRSAAAPDVVYSDIHDKFGWCVAKADDVHALHGTWDEASSVVACTT